MSDHRSLAAEVIRAWALDEGLKARAMADPALAAVARRIAARYVAGDTVDDALAAARAIIQRGHRVSLEYTGESVRDAELADRETEVFLALIGRLREAELPATISFDLSHIGLLQGADHVHRNGMRLAEAVAPLGTELMVSAEASDRTDLVLEATERLAAAGAPIGLTLQARLHRTSGDLDRALALPGPLRLVKGAFLESADTALPRDGAELPNRYVELAGTLIRSGHRVNVATHDPALVDAVVRDHPRAVRSGQVEFEMLRGLGTELLDRLHLDGRATREYAIFGTEWWLYVLNRIAEQPDRVFDAIIDAGARPDAA
ncbi:proline dehydrogenase family protein [Agromyces bauzanensis]